MYPFFGQLWLVLEIDTCFLGWVFGIYLKDTQTNPFIAHPLLMILGCFSATPQTPFFPPLADPLPKKRCSKNEDILNAKLLLLALANLFPAPSPQKPTSCVDRCVGMIKSGERLPSRERSHIPSQNTFESMMFLFQRPSPPGFGQTNKNVQKTPSKRQNSG